MTWAAIIALVLQEAPQGIALIESLFTQWSSGTNPTAADFAALRTMATQRAVDQMTTQLLAAGVSLTSPQAIALLALAGGNPVPPVPIIAPVPPVAPPA